MVFEYSNSLVLLLLAIYALKFVTVVCACMHMSVWTCYCLYWVDWRHFGLCSVLEGRGCGGVVVQLHPFCQWGETTRSEMRSKWDRKTPHAFSSTPVSDEMGSKLHRLWLPSQGLVAARDDTCRASYPSSAHTVPF